MFDHRNPQNHRLARNIADLVGATETLDIQPQGVIVKIRKIEDGTPESEQLSESKNPVSPETTDIAPGDTPNPSPAIESN